MSYRPITDVWILARAKLKGGAKYYGAYLGGFPERARALLGARLDEAVLHVCGGLAHLYPYVAGYGPLDKRLDINPTTESDYLLDARQDRYPRGFRAILADPPYSPKDADRYGTRESYPSPNLILRNSLNALPIGGRVGIVHYALPKPPKNAKFIAAVGVICGFNNRVRAFSVFEKMAAAEALVAEQTDMFKQDEAA
jgi:hypothetical protein